MTRQSDQPTGRIFVSASLEFEKDVRTLKKRYRNLEEDIRPVIEQIESGQLMGDQISGTGFVVYKVRVKNRDIKKGKSAGYRVIYQLESQDSVALLRIYSKSDTDDISIQSIQKIINEISEANETSN